MLSITNNQQGTPRTVYLGEIKQGDLWKGLEWKKIISGWSKKGTLLKVYDSSPPTNQNPPTRTVVISCVAFSRELAIVTPVAFEDGFNAAKQGVSYCFLMALSDQKGTFSPSSSNQVAVGNIYVLDFVKNKFWLIARTGIAGSAIQFNSVRRRELFVAFADHTIHCYNIDTCQLIAKLPSAHQMPPTSISVHPTRHLAISTSRVESVLWDTEVWQRKRIMEGLDRESENQGVQQTTFSPDGLMICTAFEDGSIFFWTIDTFSLVWKITLSQLVDSSVGPSTGILDVSEFHATMKKSLNVQRNSFFDLSSNGELFAYGGISSTVYVWNLFEKRLMHEILIPTFENQHILQLQFLGTTNVLAILSSGGEIMFINASHATFVSQLKGKQKFIGFALSPDGRVISTVTSDSRYVAKLVRLDQVLDPPSTVNDNVAAPVVEDATADPSAGAPQTIDPNRGLNTTTSLNRAVAQPPQTFFQLIEAKQESTLFNRSKLRGFLNHYGSYPEQYRPLIWRYLLKLPENRAGYESLLDQGTHSSFKDFRKKFPLKSDRAAKSMERILSCLAFWSPIFEDLDYLPSLVFPFVKLFWNDLFSCLEVIMTILMNWCQKWWEYYPNPPIETLELINQLLEFHDPELFAHFQRCKVTSQVFGWTVMQSLFSELFSKRDWLMVWDHLVSNSPSFMYHFITGYIIHFRRSLLSISSLKDFYYFFQRRNPTNATSIILKAYEIKAKSPTSIDPSTFLKPFTPCPPGEYPIFNQYPQFIVNYQSRMKSKIRQEEHEYIKKRQLATELSRLTQELKKEKEGWESSDWKMNEMIEKWWTQMMENEQEKGRILSRMQNLEKEKRMDAMNEFEESKKSLGSQRISARGSDKENKFGKKASMYRSNISPRKQVMTFEEDLETLENEWIRRKEEMSATRKELQKAQQLQAEKLVQRVADITVDDGKQPDASQVESLVDVSPTKSVSFAP